MLVPAPLVRVKRPPASRALALALVVAVAPAAAFAEPHWSIVRPATEGKASPLAAAPLQKRAAYEKELEAYDKVLAERYPVPFERIDVEGARDPDFRRAPPRSAELRFADALNEGSPELIAGRTYKGYYYDGTLFWGSDPLSFAYKNVTHWLTH